MASIGQANLNKTNNFNQSKSTRGFELIECNLGLDVENTKSNIANELRGLYRQTIDHSLYVRKITWIDNITRKHNAQRDS